MVEVGNDVVDLGQARCEGKAADTRFVQRVFTASEQAGILAAEDPDRALWRRWAAKEAGFKVVSKVLGSPPVFAHTAFVVDLDADMSGGIVTYREFTVPFTLVEGLDHVHTVAVHSRDDGPEPSVVVGIESSDTDVRPPLDSLQDRFTLEERAFIRSVPSALVRLAARRDMASSLAVPESDLLILGAEGAPGRVPPVVRVGGVEGLVDLSLSHDGRYVAWAFVVDQEGGSSTNS